MNYIENTNYVSDNYADYWSINQSSSLDEIAKKVDPAYIKESCDVFVPKEGKSKARITELISAMVGVYKLLKKSALTNNPVFLVIDAYDIEYASGFYFFVGTEEDIKYRLSKLVEDKYKLRQNYY